MNGLRVEVDDLRIDVGGKQESEPKTIHEAWAKNVGVDPKLLQAIQDDEDAEV